LPSASPVIPHLLLSPVNVVCSDDAYYFRREFRWPESVGEDSGKSGNGSGGDAGGAAGSSGATAIAVPPSTTPSAMALDVWAAGDLLHNLLHGYLVASPLATAAARERAMMQESGGVGTFAGGVAGMGSLPPPRGLLRTGQEALMTPTDGLDPLDVANTLQEMKAYDPLLDGSSVRFITKILSSKWFSTYDCSKKYTKREDAIAERRMQQRGHGEGQISGSEIIEDDEEEDEDEDEEEDGEGHTAAAAEAEAGLCSIM
jgi:hypothetical protein